MAAVQLLNRISDQVPPEIRARGEEYFRSGAVRSLRSIDGTIEAAVRGGSVYSVIIEFELPDEIVYECSCPYYIDRLDPCKHLWAVLLAANSRGLLPDPGRKTPYLVPGDEDDNLDDNDEDEEPEPPKPFSQRDRERRYEEMRRYWEQRRASILPQKPELPTWQERLEGIRRQALANERASPWPAQRQILYFLSPLNDYPGHPLAIRLEAREARKSGGWGALRPQPIDHGTLSRLPDPADRQIGELLLGAAQYPGAPTCPAVFYPAEPMLARLLPLLGGTGRCGIVRTAPDAEPRFLQVDEGEPWLYLLDVRREDPDYVIEGVLARAAERAAPSEAILLPRAGWAILRGSLARFEAKGAAAWIDALHGKDAIAVPVKQHAELLEALLTFPSLPNTALPEELRYTEVELPMQPFLKIRKSPHAWQSERLQASLVFDYQGHPAPALSPGDAISDSPQKRRILRNMPAEAAAIAVLEQTAFRRDPYAALPHVHWIIAVNKLPAAVRALAAVGWHIEAEGKLFRPAGAFHIEVRSGIDWFELHGRVEFGEGSARLPDLLAALQRRENTVLLDDGTLGILPEEWLRKYGILAGLGTPHEHHLRFRPSQAGLLDALLAAEPAASCDEVFEQARARLRSFAGIAPADPTEGFTGRLREYQREGLGWIGFLREFGFGGCLADDMGLGKTVQVLALLEQRRDARPPGEPPLPSLVVAPRSLIFNWKQEAARFTPRLRVVDHTGTGRTRAPALATDCDLVLTTYGTLRRDAAFLKDCRFDYVVLDEAQAIKNTGSASAKAARLLKGNHRLALSGTPVENHLGELWSLFEFLNPGMLGAASVLKLGQGELRKPDPEARGLLAHALRPFILRRTKAQVALDLPDKVEQTLYCEMDRPQRKLYDELREHYRRLLMNRVEREGIGRAKIQILEALLRLRQAALHPGLIDPGRADEPCAKLEALLPQIDEVIDSGHKALVFSQFTSMLAIVRQRIEQKRLPYAYLDGQTRDRQSVVERFQNDPACSLFLISLKAGGLGLNLTAAEYVFILDPWWNPAVEMQAIDRSHRIGQTHTVFAYRLIARDTVEEKVLELQQAKRNLAQAIISEDNALIRDLRPEDLALLLG